MIKKTNGNFIHKITHNENKNYVHEKLKFLFQNRAFFLFSQKELGGEKLRFF